MTFKDWLKEQREIESKATPGEWSQGFTIMTSTTKRWSSDEFLKNDIIEKLRVFANFTDRDLGRSRTLICSAHLETLGENAEFICQSRNNYRSMLDALEIADTVIHDEFCTSNYCHSVHINFRKKIGVK